MDRGEARRLAKSFMNEIQETTAIEYKNAAERLGSAHWMDYAEAHNLTKRSAGILRAAWRRRIAKLIMSAIEESEKLPTPEQRKSARKKMDNLADALSHDEEWTYQPTTEAQKAGEQSKRKSLRGLPIYWRERILKLAKPKDKALVVGLILGCRPEELRKGIILSNSNNELIIYIRGAKITKISGQKERLIKIYAPNIINLLGIQDGETIEVFSDSGQAFQKRISRLAEREGFKGVTPYSFRHQFSADLKHARNEKSDIAMALGHRAAETQRNYGHPNQAKGGNTAALLSVQATTAPRTQPSSRTLDFKAI